MTIFVMPGNLPAKGEEKGATLAKVVLQLERFGLLAQTRTVAAWLGYSRSGMTHRLFLNHTPHSRIG
jgi:hypothetical protein